MSCFRARWQEHEHDAVFRLYMAKGMQLCVKAVACAQLPDYEELIGMETYRDNRSGEEIAAEVIKNAGLEVVTGGSV